MHYFPWDNLRESVVYNCNFKIHRTPLSEQAILLTAGAKGAAYDIRGHKGYIPCFRSCEIVETTGAGDAFSAGFITSCLQLMSKPNSKRGSDGKRVGSGMKLEWDVESAREAVRFGSAVGALTCGGDGAIVPQPSLEDVDQLMSREILAA